MQEQGAQAAAAIPAPLAAAAGADPRAAAWLRLEALLNRPRRGRRRLTPAEAAELASLYRRAATDLALARHKEPDSPLTLYLNDLVMRAHGRLYAPLPTRLTAVWSFFRTGFPELVARHRRAILLASALFVLGALIGYAAVAGDPNLAEALVPKQFREHQPDARTGELSPPGMAPLDSTAIMLNNIQVGVLSFGLGLTFGIGTVYVLLFNGLILGALAAVFHGAGLGVPFWATILPHGVIELTAIALDGAAGFVMAGALVRPGTLTRRQALARAAIPALGLVAGTIPMYVVAGTIEGFITPRSIPHAAKLAFAAFTALPLALYMGFRLLRRRATAAPAP